MFKSWLETQPDLLKAESDLLTGLFEWFVDAALELLRKQCKEILATQNMQLVRNLMYMIEMHLDKKCLQQEKTEN